MRITSVAQVRNDLLQDITDQTGYPIGINTTPYNDIYSATVVPHGSAGRVNFTQPAGDYLLIQMICLRIRRATAPTTVGRCSWQIRVSEDSAANLAAFSQCELIDATVGAFAYVNIPCNFVIEPTVRLLASSEDLSVGGTVNFELGIHGRTFTP